MSSRKECGIGVITTGFYTKAQGVWVVTEIEGALDSIEDKKSL